MGRTAPALTGTVSAVNDYIQRAQVIEQRQVVDAWQRIESWLHQHAPATLAKLRPGASEAEIAALQQTLGVRLPEGLKALWRQHSGCHPGPLASFILGQGALMDFDAVLSVYQQKMLLQRREDELNRQRGGGDKFTMWRAAWIPFCSFGVDCLSGLCLDVESGRLWYWSEYAERTVGFESLTAYLEEMADVLEVPSLATGDKPGLVNGVLVWGPPRNAAERASWEPITE